MSWWNTPLSKIVHAIAERPRRPHTAPKRSSRTQRSGKFSPGKHPLQRNLRQRPVPTELRAAMATLQTGDFIFDPCNGR
jgi:hypothetical protein